MATKSDLIEAQNFSRRRLLTAFVSGAPGGKELQPAAPLRAVIAAIALTLGVILVGVFYGLVKPGLPNGWENGKLVLVSDTGARFVTVDGTLHPVINTASARLLLPASGFGVISTDQQNLAGVTVGSTLGIVGAPDELPAPGRLSNSGWTACTTSDAGVDVRLGQTGPVATDAAAVVSMGNRLYVVAGGRTYAVSTNGADAVLRAAGITAADPVKVSADWLNLFVPGTPLAPIVVDRAGQSLAGSTLAIGDVVHSRGTPDDERYLVQSDGSLAPLTPLAWQLYLLGSGSASGKVVEVSPAETANLPTAQPAGGKDWPTTGFTGLASSQRPCALLNPSSNGAETVLAAQSAATDAKAGISVAPGSGALVRAGGRGEQASGILTLVDATGTAYPLPGANEETVNRLGYRMSDVGAVGQGWTALFRVGPELTEAAAGKTPAAGG